MAGINTKIEHNGVTYIIQTQDLGTPSYCIETLIYKSGKALPPRKNFYSQLLNSSTFQELLDQLLEQEHKDAIKTIADGQFDHI